MDRPHRGTAGHARTGGAPMTANLATAESSAGPGPTSPPSPALGPTTPRSADLDPATPRSADLDPATPPNTGNIVEARDLVKSFGETPALRGASLGVRQGEIVAVMGPS